MAHPYIQDQVKKNTVFNLIFNSAAYKELQLAFDKHFHGPLWWTAEHKGQKSVIRPLPRSQRAPDIEDYLSISEYKKTVARTIRQADRSRTAVIFPVASNNTFGITIPVVTDSKVLGFFGACGIKQMPEPVIASIMAGYAKAITEEIAKSQELSRVYELVRPHSIALSTVHTIHRLISSILDIKELFPRIARLSLQVLRAECAAIFMIDKQTNALSCVASVNYRKSKDIFDTKNRPSPVEKRVAHTGIMVFRPHMLVVPLVDEEVCGVIAVRDKIGRENFSVFDKEILTTLAEQAVIAIRNAQLYKEQEDLTIGIIRSLSHLLDAKFPRIYTHTEFFTALMVELGKELQLQKNELKLLHYSAILPDLGKLVVPEEILRKPKALSGKERKIIKTHTVRGIEILKYLDVLKPVIPIILHHHERFDGSGYPDKLRGRAIPLGARIMAVADAFEAMVCYRSYRKARPYRMAVSEIRRQAGKQFDPDAVKAFMAIANDGRLEGLMKKYDNDIRT